MTADPSEEPGRPDRRRRRRRRPRKKGGPTPTPGPSPDGGNGTGSSDAPPVANQPDASDRDAGQTSSGSGGTPARRRRRRRSRKPGPAGDGGSTAGSTAASTVSRGGSATHAAASGNGGRRRNATKRRSGAKPRARIPTQKEVSAGGVVYRRNDDGTLEILLASRRTRRGDLAWGLAKGGIEDGETNEDAAIREVREETGIVAEIEGSLGETKYFYVWEDVRIRKTVHFFLMRAVGGDPDDRDDEMEEIRWFPMERALKRAGYRGEREVLGRAAELLET